MELLAAEKHQVEALKNMQHQNRSLSILDEILEDVRKAADRLEEEIEEHAFDDNKSVSSSPGRFPLRSGCVQGGCAAEFAGTPVAVWTGSETGPEHPRGSERDRFGHVGVP